MVAFLRHCVHFYQISKISIHVFVCQDDIQTTEVYFFIKIILMYYLFINLFFNLFILFVYFYCNCMHSNNFRRNMYYCLERKIKSLPHFSRKHNLDNEISLSSFCINVMSILSKNILLNENI